MWGETISPEDLDTLTETLANVVQRVGTLEELEGWLRSQPCIESVNVADYFIKTEPPQKELVVIFKQEDGSTVTKILDIRLYPDQALGLAGLHEP